MINREHIENLVEKFLDGRTTNAEERELYAWFRREDLPAEWRELKEMFAWYEAGMPESEPAMEHTSAAHRGMRNMWIGAGAISAIAASVALMIVMFRPSEELPQPTYNIYDGSYIVEQGVRYDNIEYIEHDIEDLLARADVFELKANELLAWADMQ